MTKILLAEPSFPIPAKSKNHKNFLPIGLLKIASYLDDHGTEVKLTRGYSHHSLIPQKELIAFHPDEVWVTSLFTYWAQYVKDTVEYFRRLFPDAKITVGGIYASLMPDHCKSYTQCDGVYEGVLEQAEKYPPAYNLLDDFNGNHIDYQIIHASRGCKRQCPFCGVWKIESDFLPKKSIIHEISARKIVFYDNNLLYNPYIEDIMDELISLKKAKKLVWCESQSGFDGRILLEKSHLAQKLKEAGFRYPRLAWDGKYSQEHSIKEQIDLLVEAGYTPSDIFVFMIYNWDFTFEEMEKKRLKCWDWKVQIADCRFRPLDQTYDNYDPHQMKQTGDDYYIHMKGGWTDSLVRQFRKNVRRQNICIRQRVPFYSNKLEHKLADRNIISELGTLKTLKQRESYLDSLNVDFWFPDQK
jgi:hypothetical protein